MSTLLHQGLSVTPDLGRLKRAPDEYQSAQNVRGWAKRTMKRQGVRTAAVHSSGIMGIHDLKIDGDAASLDRILVTLANGSWQLYSYAELTTYFTYQIDNSINLVLQAPNSTWYAIQPNDTTGILRATEAATPSTTRSTDLIVRQYQQFGFVDATGVWRLYSGIGGKVKVQRYPLSEPETLYSSDLAFVSGKGVVFEDDNLELWRLSVRNDKSLRLTSI